MSKPVSPFLRTPINFVAFVLCFLAGTMADCQAATADQINTNILFGSSYNYDTWPPSVVLTNAAQILALPTDHASGVQVSIRGVVTAAEPGAIWFGRFFVQDRTAGVFVENIGTNQPKPGDLVEIKGISHPGGYAPIISNPQWHKLGTAPLPEAQPVLIEQLMAGIDDSQRVEITGIVRGFRPLGEMIVFDVVSGGYRLEVNAPPPEGVDAERLIGAKVRIRGTAATFFNGKLRHLISVTLHVPRSSDFLIENTQAEDPFADRIIPVDSLAQYRNDRELAKRVHVKGIVTYQRSGEDLFLQDVTGGLQVKSRLPTKVKPGDIVEAVGFPGFEHYLPVLEDAVFRETDEPRRKPTNLSVTISDLGGGFRHANLITLQGKVLDSKQQWISPRSSGESGQRTILTLQSSDFIFTVQGPMIEADEIKFSVPIGSVVEASGVCLMEIAEDGKLQSLQVLLPAATDLKILQKAAWWTTQRLLFGLAGSFTVVILALSWIVMVSRTNAALKVSIHEKEQAQIGLQDANDHLEERVKERTEQLKLQITARVESELQFKAVLNERTRLAQELHDTLQQTLTGIALQMDTASKFSNTDAGRRDHHLDLARNLVTQSQSDVRCSVWDLRSRSHETMDLARLLLTISKQLTEDTRIAVSVVAKGRVRPLVETIEENLLRIAMEALTNCIKHSQASQVTIALDYKPRDVILTISDNGISFIPERQAGPREGHFGLLGIRERASRLNGNVTISSEPGKGTTIQAVIPIEMLPDSILLGSQLGAEI
jgi:signal transduction histidine kinase